MNSFVEDSCGTGESCRQRLSKDADEKSESCELVSLQKARLAGLSLWLTKSFSTSRSYFSGMHNPKFHTILNNLFFFFSILIRDACLTQKVRNEYFQWKGGERRELALFPALQLTSVHALSFLSYKGLHQNKQ